MTTLPGGFHAGLVALSVLIAVVAAGAALDLAGRVTTTRGWPQRGWLAGGAVAMGLGIWSMHYTGMLAFQLPVEVYYHIPTVFLSLLAAVLASGVALFLASRPHLGAWRFVAGSLLMGWGIAGMHYIGMDAMRVPAQIQWRWLLVVLSVVMAMAISAIALWLAFRFGHASDAWSWQKAAAAVVMGLAIPTMHYTGMAAARFVTPAPRPDLALAIDVSAMGRGAIVAGTFVVLLIAIFTSTVDRHIAAERARAQEVQTALIHNLQTALAEVKVLRGILPICANCKRVRTEQGGWEQIESYVRGRTEAEFSHGLCPDCARTTWGAELA